MNADVKLVVVLLLVVGGAYYWLFHSPWQPTPSYDGSAPNYGSNKKTVQFTTDQRAPDAYGRNQQQRQEALDKYNRGK